jgi:FkbM family methyltransferase
MIKKIFKQNTHNLLFKWVGGFGLSIYRMYENRNHRLESNGERTLLKKLGRTSPQVILDGGANVGKYTREVLQHCREAKVYSFEPVKDTFLQLEEALRGEERVRLIPRGLFSEAGKKEINLYPSHTHASVYRLTGVPYESTGTLTIEMVRGDDFVREEGLERIDLLKLDLEGAEYDALEGFEDTLRAGRIRLVQFEYGYINILSKHLLLDYYRFFEEKGYIVGKIFPRTVKFRPYRFKYEDFIGPNFVAVRREDRELIDLLRKR